MRKDITVILRSVGERTEQVCLSHIKQEIPEGNISLIKNKSLSESTIELCKTAIKSGRPWTLLIGGDYIPRPGFLGKLHLGAKLATQNTQLVKGTIIDKFAMELRGERGGPHLYRTDLLKTWLQILPDVDNGITTEAQCQKYFYKKGYIAQRNTFWVALHDFEQHYKDIYRSMFVYGRKWPKLQELLPRWERAALNDNDFKVALYAYQKGAEYKKTVNADFQRDYGFSESPFKTWEKPPLKKGLYDVSNYDCLSYESYSGIV